RPQRRQRRKRTGRVNAEDRAAAVGSARKGRAVEIPVAALDEAVRLKPFRRPERINGREPGERRPRAQEQQCCQQRLTHRSPRMMWARLSVPAPFTTDYGRFERIAPAAASFSELR